MTRTPVQKLRTLADVEPHGRKPRRTPEREAQARKARKVLDAEFGRILDMQQKMKAEAAVGGKEKGRAPAGQPEKVRGMIASLEGMNRFALQMKLISPAESRELYAAAIKRGLYDGWR